MQAFPKDSLNNVLGGSGPLNVRPDHATFMGHAEDEAFKDFATMPSVEKMGSSSNMPVFDPLARGSVLHGDQTMGLGTSTFLEGTPAAKTVIQRTEAERVADTTDSGLQRKKSLAQRIRNINRGPPRDFQPSGRMTNPEGVVSWRSPSVDMPTSHAMAYSAQPSTSDRNPFFDEFDSKKSDEIITVRRTDSLPMTPQSPERGRERRATLESMNGQDDSQAMKQGGGGLLARVKSLKGGRRTRPMDAPPPGKEA